METSRPDQSDRDIVDVGAGGAGDNQAIAFLQGMVGIVISQRGKDIAALGFQRGLGGAVHKAASGISGAVGAIRANGEHRAAIKPDPAAVRAVNEALEAAFEKATE